MFGYRRSISKVLALLGLGTLLLPITGQAQGQGWKTAEQRREALQRIMNACGVRHTDQAGVDSLCTALPGLRGLRPEQVCFVKLGSDQFRRVTEALGTTRGLAGFGATPHRQANDWSRYSTDTHPHLLLNREPIPGTHDSRPFTWLFDAIEPGWGGGRARFSPDNPQSYFNGQYGRMTRTFAIDRIPKRMLIFLWAGPEGPVAEQGRAAHERAWGQRDVGINCAQFVTENLIALARRGANDPNNPLAAMANQGYTDVGGQAIHSVTQAARPDLVIEFHP